MLVPWTQYFVQELIEAVAQVVVQFLTVADETSSMYLNWPVVADDLKTRGAATLTVYKMSPCAPLVPDFADKPMPSSP